MTTVVEAHGLARRYPGPPPVTALAEATFSIGGGELVGVVGPSGSGKSTLLNLLGLLDRPTAGRLHLAGHDVAAMAARSRAAVRARQVGFVFQAFHLLAALTALENVAIALLYLGVPPERRLAMAAGALEAVGLGGRAHHRPHQLSGGEQQRVAVARALVKRPALVLADEPTGNLDRASGRAVLALLSDQRAADRAVVVVTHDPEVAARLPRVLAVVDGRVRETGP